MTSQHKINQFQLSSSQNKYIGYWRESAHSLNNPYKNLITYPENNHSNYSHTFTYPRPNHFDNFWSKPENKDFITRFINTVLFLSKKIKTKPEQTSKCRLCKKKFYNVFEYIYEDKINTKYKKYYIASTYTHYLIDHKLTPDKELQNLIKIVEEKQKQIENKYITDDWVYIDSSN